MCTSRSRSRPSLTLVVEAEAQFVVNTCTYLLGHTYTYLPSALYLSITATSSNQSINQADKKAKTTYRHPSCAAKQQPVFMNIYTTPRN